MKALQTRSPIYLYYEYTDLTKVVVSIYLDKDPNNFDTTTTPRYNLQSESINNESIFEISDLLRSANQYEFEKDFYEKRDTAIYVLCKADLYDSNDDLIEVRHNFLRVRDGYIERQDQSQILNNFLKSDVRNWNNNDSNTIITANQNDPFGGLNAYLLKFNNQFSGGVILSNNVDLTGTYTYSAWFKQKTTNVIILDVNATNQDNTLFDLNTGLMADVSIFFNLPFFLGFSIFKIGDWFQISYAIKLDDISSIRVKSGISSDDEVFIFNPIFIKGNYINLQGDYLNGVATDLVLQDNVKGYSTNNITNQILVDRNLGNVYSHGLPVFDIKQYFEDNPKAQSAIIEHDNNNLKFKDLFNPETEAELQNIVLYECKYQPVKVTFLNRFGVLQDLVFFKKRVDSSSTDSESYKANVITNGEVYPHLGQRRVYNKGAEASVKLSSGFYPESFNTVFKQLIFSEMVFIDDEPAVVSTSTFRQKTQIDDKLINYDIDFDFANDDINSIR